MQTWRVLLAAIAMLATEACGGSPIELGGVKYPGSPALPASVLGGVPPSGACPGSVRMARAGSELFAAWWAIRDDSSSVLMAGRSTDGGTTWTAVRADTLDTSRRGCARPAPAIAADSATNYVDIAYFLEAREGPGIFFTHSMDAHVIGRGDGVFHSPVAIMYGDHPAAVSVAASGDRVAVAYEDPNGERPAVGLALSTTMGHIFSDRVQVSGSDVPARDPVISISDSRSSRPTRVTLQWVERADSANRGRIAVRRGEWR